MSIQYTVEQLQRKFPDSPGPGFARIAEVMRGEGRIDEAIQVCQEGLRDRPYHLAGYLVHGKCLLDAGRLEEAREQFEAALNLDARCLSAMHNLALIMGAMQSHDAAAGYCRAILAVEPWDGKAEAMLRESAAAAAASPSAPKGRAPGAVPAPLPQEGPADGRGSDVVEFDLNRVADFLPAGSADPASGLEDIPLADALSQAAETPRAEDAPAAPRGDASSEPAPMDLLREDSGAVPTGGDGAPSPISGHDVEERLDSLFGLGDEPAPARPASDERRDEDRLFAADVSDGLPASASGGWKAALIEDLPPESPSASAAIAREASPSKETGVFPPGAFGGDERVSGDDVEKRLEDLFGLGSGDGIAESPRVEDVAAFPEAPVEEVSAAEPPVAEAEDLVVAPEFGGTTQFGQTTMFEAPRPAEEDLSDMVSGQDVADKLDDLFGEEPKAPEKPKARAAGPYSPQTGTAYEAREGRFPEPGPSDILSTESMIPSSLGAEGLAPVTGDDIEDRLDQLFDLHEDAPSPGAAFPAPEPEVHGGELSAEERATFQSYSHAKAEDTGTFKTLEPEQSAPPGRAGILQGVDDPTLVMPAIQAPVEPPPQDSPAAGDTLILSASDMRSRETGEFPAFSATDTAAVEMVEGSDVVNRLDELFQEEPGLPGFATAGVENAPAASQTPPAVGRQFPHDVAPPPLESLRAQDDLPLSEDSDLSVAPMGSAAGSAGTGDTVVSGEDVTSRLSELFEVPAIPESVVELPEPQLPEIEVPFFLDEPGAAETASGPDSDATLFESKPAFSPSTSRPSPAGPMGEIPPEKPRELAPMQDEEEGYPEEEEMPATSAAGANVATVTLAEIYFQQGLREQALQIYRQLLEREPGNDSVRKRIQEIEASKPEGDKGQGGDLRRPRPGLKVPKRKK